MASVIRGTITSLLSNCSLKNTRFVTQLINANAIQVRNYAARKGTREKAKKKKVKVEVKKVGFIPHNQRGTKAPVIVKRIDDSMKPDPVDNVWFSKYYKWPIYSFESAVQCHRETHHPTVYNNPDSELFVNLELDMRAAKTNRYLDSFTRIVSVPHPFNKENARSVLVICKSPELQRSALEAGATVAGDVELIKNIQNGELNLQDFHFVIAHPDILPELVSLRGIMKRKFPSQKSGTLGLDIQGMVSKFCTGIEYTAKVSQYVQDFGWIFTPVGKLDMDVSHLEANFTALLKDVNSMRPKREGPFITKCCLVSLPSPERLKIDFSQYIDEVRQGEKDENEDADNEQVKDEEQKTSVMTG
ncbi:large ribosomal subunit protein uL1m [Periplaneta americana]|uniref:large ribosomal subunit protein uL1m n=1 Tax=Periplaneta americana TaxID=6978 RepID=UPI0037E83141